MRVKICGVTDEEAVDAAVQAGADAIGFVFARSVRRLDPATAKMLLARVPSTIVRVAVVANPGDLERAILRDLAFDVVQGDVDSLAKLIGIPLPQLPVFHDSEDLIDRLQASFASSSADPFTTGFLVDGPGAGLGVAGDYTRAKEAARRGGMVLAGGLSATNVAAAIRIVRPAAVDVSSGVESAPGKKDPAAIAAFIQAARAAHGVHA